MNQDRILEGGQIFFFCILMVFRWRMQKGIEHKKCRHFLLLMLIHQDANSSVVRKKIPLLTQHVSTLPFQIFHGVWTIAFFCLNIIDTRAVLPNASCLLAGYLPATTVLHILLIPNDYPLEFIITDAVGTFLAIITMFLLLRMECTGEEKK